MYESIPYAVALFLSALMAWDAARRWMAIRNSDLSASLDNLERARVDIAALVGHQREQLEVLRESLKATDEWARDMSDKVQAHGELLDEQQALLGVQAVDISQVKTDVGAMGMGRSKR